MGDQRAFRRGIYRWVDQRLDYDAGVLTAPACVPLSLFITQTTPGRPGRFNCTFQIMTPSYCIPLHFCINNSALSLMFRRRPRGEGDGAKRGLSRGDKRRQEMRTTRTQRDFIGIFECSIARMGTLSCRRAKATSRSRPVFAQSCRVNLRAASLEMLLRSSRI